MWTGAIESIHIASAAKRPTQAVDQVHAIPGVGLIGDRYAQQQGTFSKPEPDFDQGQLEIRLGLGEGSLLLRIAITDEPYSRNGMHLIDGLCRPLGRRGYVNGFYGSGPHGDSLGDH